MRVYEWVVDSGDYHGDAVIVVAESVKEARRLAVERARDYEREDTARGVQGKPTIYRLPAVVRVGRGD